MKERIFCAVLVLSTWGCDGSPASDAGGPSADAGTGDGGVVADGGRDAGASDAGEPCGVDLGLEGDLLRTTTGPFRGEIVGGVVAFRGIPFAEPPLGERRFLAPTPAACTTAERPAVSFPALCPQLDETDAPVGQEDCLYLNVWVPTAPAPAAGRPVLIFIHGGGNTQGGTSNERGGGPLYDGAFLAEDRDVVVVTLDYRLGALGFLAHPALGAESAVGASGNYGILDQIEALRWVQANLTAMGGDPTRRLVFGESAGARDTCTLVATPLASGLFTRALMQSGNCNQPSLADREMEGEMYAAMVGCDATDPVEVAACLRAAPAADLAALSGGVSSGGVITETFGPTVDGYVLTDEPIEMIRRGEHNHVPFVVGANADETTVLGVPAMMTELEYRAAVHARLPGALGDQALALYPSSDFASPRAAFVALTTDAQFVCGARRIAVAADAGQSESVYRYYFSDRVVPLFGAFHGAELFYVFGRLDGLGSTAPAASLGLASEMRAAWTAFADSGNPGAAWPTYDATDPYTELAAPIVMGAGLHTARCDFWDSLLM
ncbi:MAG: carboxylesterase/lipase family protein [Sandaracinaceae bacterium]